MTRQSGPSLYNPSMQTVNFNCPHCKQVVRAPAAAGEPPIQSPVAAPPPPPQAPAPTFNIPQQTEHHESIFGERLDEDVFGSEPLKPTFAPLPSAPSQPT